MDEEKIGSFTLGVGIIDLRHRWDGYNHQLKNKILVKPPLLNIIYTGFGSKFKGRSPEETSPKIGPSRCARNTLYSVTHCNIL